MPNCCLKRECIYKNHVKYKVTLGVCMMFVVFLGKGLYNQLYLFNLRIVTFSPPNVVLILSSLFFLIRHIDSVLFFVFMIMSSHNYVNPMQVL